MLGRLDPKPKNKLRIIIITQVHKSKYVRWYDTSYRLKKSFRRICKFREYLEKTNCGQSSVFSCCGGWRGSEEIGAGVGNENKFSSRHRNTYSSATDSGDRKTDPKDIVYNCSSHPIVCHLSNPTRPPSLPSPAPGQVRNQSKFARDDLAWNFWLMMRIFQFGQMAAANSDLLLRGRRI